MSKTSEILYFMQFTYEFISDASGKVTINHFRGHTNYTVFIYKDGTLIIPVTMITGPDYLQISVNPNDKGTVIILDGMEDELRDAVERVEVQKRVQASG